MNKDYALFHLKEAQEELQRTILELESDPDYGSGDFLVAMSHLYHHINTAWNARESSEADVAECSDENFSSWRQMPRNEELMLEDD